MKQIAPLVAGLGYSYATYHFSALAYTLSAAGQFITPILAAIYTIPCAVFGFIFIKEAFDQ